MADATPKTEGHKGARKHTGLGRGLGALIPQADEQKSPTPPAPPARPLDVFFPEGPAASGRGGSAKDLLQPKRATASSNKKRHAMPTLDIGAARRTVNASNPLGSGINGSAPDQSGSTPRVVPVETIAQSVPDVSRETSEENELLPVPGASFAEIAIDQIVPNAKQPREVFDEDDLKELSASIKEVGVLQPVVVRNIPATGRSEKLQEYLADKPDARYELIMGERRLRASELAGETTIPAIIRETDDGDLLRDALLENLHRAQLNPLEEASAYQQLMADFGATQEELAKRIARARRSPTPCAYSSSPRPSRRRWPHRSSPRAMPAPCCPSTQQKTWNDSRSASSRKASQCAPLKRSSESARSRPPHARAPASKNPCLHWERAS